MKQRLIGAAVLVVLAVIFLPMVFDGADETQSESIDLSIPAEPTREFETRVVPLDPPAPPADANAIVTVDANAPARVDAMSGTRDAPSAPAAAPSSTPQPAVPAPAPPAAATTTTTPPPAPAAATVPSPAPTEVAGGRYAVSFGSYANPENARGLAASLVKGGIAARAEDVDVNGKPGMRVRAGPYADRAEAEKVRLQARAVRADAPGTIVEIADAAAAAASEAAPASRAGAWAVQIGAYADESEATAQREKLRRAGFAAYIDTVRTEKGTLHRVRVGPEPARAGAETLRSSLKSKLGVDGLVVAHP